jgi:hypothetical protein
LLSIALIPSAQRISVPVVQASIEAITPPLQTSGFYAKSRTQFDGIGSQNSVTFLKVHANSTNYFQLSSANPLNSNLDITV